jgi:hypothetical protein
MGCTQSAVVDPTTPGNVEDALDPVKEVKKGDDEQQPALFPGLQSAKREPPKLSDKRGLSKKGVKVINASSPGKPLKQKKEQEEEQQPRVPPPQMTSETTKKSNMPHLSQRMKKYSSTKINLIDFDVFKKQKEIPRFPNCQPITEVFDVDTFNHTESIIVYVSHCWIAGWNGRDERDEVLSGDHDRNWRGFPHPDNKKNDKYKLIVEGVESIWLSMAPTTKKCYLWIDYSCINQDIAKNDSSGSGKSVCDGLESLDLLVRAADLLFTPVVDYKWNDWKIPPLVANNSNSWFEAYKAASFQGTRYSYMNRSWCRMEMLYGTHVPYADHGGDARIQLFRGALKQGATKGMRCHFVYGTKENKEGGTGKVLPPLSGSALEQYHPLAGFLEVPGDRKKIESLMKEIEPYLKKATATAMTATVTAEKGDEDVDNNSEGGESAKSVLSVNEGKGEEEEEGDQDQEPQSANENDTEIKNNSNYTRRPQQVRKKSKQRSSKGTGTFEYKNGDSYTGEYLDDLREGHGVMTFGASKYEGSWKGNKRHGHGKLTSTITGLPLSSRKGGDSADNDGEDDGDDQQQQQAQFIGEFKEDSKVQGIEIMPDGSKYEGSYFDNQKSGIGTFVFKNGDVYNGEWREDEMNGVGKYDYISSGSSYEGFFEHGKMHGTGVYTSRDGVYTGTFHHDVKHGRGVYKWVNGEEYEGDYQENVRHGDGVYRYRNGDVYSGAWTADKQTGFGTLTNTGTGSDRGNNKIDSGGGLSYKGNFVDGKFEGVGELEIKGRRYEGSFANNQMHGSGTLKYANGNIYVGNFEHGKRTGQGHLLYSKGDEYKGGWRDDAMEGLGKFTYSNGDVFEGEFRGGKRHGRGSKWIAATGVKKEGLWKEDNFFKEG